MINFEYFKLQLNQARAVISFGFINEKDIETITSNIKIYKEIDKSVFVDVYDKINLFIIKLLEDL